MSFREKSAWVMALLLAASGLYYLHIVRSASDAISGTASPTLAIAFVILVVIGSIVSQILLALVSPREANAPADERERIIGSRAGSGSGLVLAAGAVGALGHFMVHGDGNMLFHLVMASLILAQIAEYGLQIYFLRRGV